VVVDGCVIFFTSNCREKSFPTGFCPGLPGSLQRLSRPLTELIGVGMDGKGRAWKTRNEADGEEGNGEGKGKRDLCIL